MYKEAVHALVRIGGSEALHALANGLTSTQPKIASISAFGLGLWGSPEALAPLRARLRNIIDSAPAENVLDLIRAIGKIGRAEASSDLAEILYRRTFFRRKRLVEIQLGAVAALAKIPSEGAQQALKAASRRGNGNVKKAAQDALDKLAARTP
jgi:HEAT repeat protein